MFEKKNSLTRALFFHPIISHILFPQDDSKLNKLEFVRQNNNINDVLNKIEKISEIDDNKLFIDLQEGIKSPYKLGIYLEVFKITYKLLILKEYTQNQRNIAIKKMRYKSSKWRSAYNGLSEEDKRLKEVIEVWNKINNA